MSNKARFALLGVSMLATIAGSLLKANQTLSTALFSAGMLGLIVVIIKGGGC